MPAQAKGAQPIAISALTATSCLGTGLTATCTALRAQRTGLIPCNFETVQLDTYVGQVAGLEAQSWPTRWAQYDCRNNRLAQLGLAQDSFSEAAARAVSRYGARRV